ncbi:MAG: hypothetical protein ACRCT8_17080 [Lacipirellulaceae bacterium]
MRLSVRKLFALSLVVGCVAGLPARAAVNYTGQVRPASTSFGGTLGISPQGNVVDDFLADPVFPGGGAGGLAWNDPLIWVNYDNNQNILVGETGFGFLEINSDSDLRYQNVVLGGVSVRSGGDFDTATGLLAEYDWRDDAFDAGPSSNGFGVFNVTGFGSAYSNDPYLVDEEYITAIDAVTPGGGAAFFGGAAFRLRRGGADFGYDFHVGLRGRGQLNVIQGGRVEVMDAVTAGMAATANGAITVDGVGSYLVANGRSEFNAGNGESTRSRREASIIGGFGNGSLSITTGGTVDMFNGAGVGAVWAIGVVPPANATGGTGSVLVDGAGSSWNIAPSAIGIPTESTPNPPPGSRYGLLVGDFSRLDTLAPRYETGGGGGRQFFGAGSVTIRNGGIVRVSDADGFQGGASDLVNANVGVGRLGEIVLGDSSPSVVNPGTGAAGTLSVANRLENDGTIRGDGSIVSGVFYNRYLGRVSVGEGESLSVRSNGLNPFNDAQTGGEVLNGAGGNPHGGDFFQANAGAISVEGGELVFGRASDQGVNSGQPPVRSNNMFHNLRFIDVSDSSTTAVPLFDEDVRGTITSRNGTLRFESGIYNTSVMAFVGGSNLVAGDVINAPPIDYDGDPGVTQEFLRRGTIVVSGDGTSVTFEDDLRNDGVISTSSLNRTGNVITVLGNYYQNGVLLTNPGTPPIVIANRAFIQGGSFVMSSASGVSFDAGYSQQLISAAGGVDGVYSSLSLPTLAAGLRWDPIYTTTDITLVVSATAIVLPGDANSDGLVTAADYTVWRDTLGSTTDLRGDFNGDGVVEQGDYLTWVANYGRTATSFLATAIPEPAAAVLMGLAAMGLGRRRR